MTTEILATQAVDGPKVERSEDGARMVPIYHGESATLTMYTMPDGEVFLELVENAQCVLYLRELKLKAQPGGR